MFKVKQKITKILVACLTALFALVMVVGGIFAMPNTPANATGEGEGSGTLITDVNTLAANDQVVIVAKDYDYALSTTQNGNNRGQASITKSTDATATFGDDVQIITLEAGTIDGTFAFNVGNGYLYAASSSKNYLRTETNLSDNSSWTIAIAADGTATVTAQGTNTRNVMQYNQSSSIFACYSSASQKAIQLYKWTPATSGGDEPDTPACEHPNIEHNEAKDSTCDTVGNIEYWYCADCNKYFSDANYTEEIGEKDTEIPALGHTEEVTSTKDATCTEAGSKTLVCTVCGDTRTEEIAALGHNYVDGVCTVCNAKKPAIVEATITFDNTSKRTEYSTSKQVWVENDITVTNDKASSSTNVADYFNPARFYKGSSLNIEVPGAITQLVFTASGSSYATVIKESIGDTASANDATVTVTINPATSKTFTIASFTAQTRVSSITVTYNKPDCDHVNQTTTTVDATCAKSGSITVTCSDCGTEVSREEIPALGHNYVDGSCSVCGEQDPTTINHEGYYYFAVKRSSGNYFYIGNAWDNSKDRYVATDSGLTELGTITEIDMSYVFYVVKNIDGTYNIYEMNDGEAFGGNVSNVTIKKNENGTFAITNKDEVYFSFNNATGSNYIKWYTSEQVREISFVPVDLSAKIKEATITIGEDLKLNYYVTLSEALANAQMTFTMGENSEIVEGVKNGEFYVFSWAIAPDQIAENVAAELKFNDLVLASKAEYSVKAYAQSMLNKDISDSLKQLLSDLLYYGDAAYNYVSDRDGLSDATPVTAGVENLKAASTEEPATTDFTITTATLPEGVESYGAWFTGATVWFGDTNKIVVKISTTENVKLTVKVDDNEPQEVAVTSTEIYTDAILATGFAETYTFVLSYDNVVMQTLTYSVNAYAHQMQGDDTNMGKLALALYRYGVSAEAYKASLEA